MRPLVFIGLGIGFMLMGAGLFALTLKKPKPGASMPTKSQLREEAVQAEETKKLRIAGGAIAGFGALLFFLSFI